MTNEEQHQITGQIVHELAEARRMLVCLERKSEKMADDFGFIIEMLFGNLQFKDVQLAEDLSVSKALALIKEANETKVRIDRLQAKLDQLV